MLLRFANPKPRSEAIVRKMLSIPSCYLCCFAEASVNIPPRPVFHSYQSLWDSTQKIVIDCVSLACELRVLDWVIEVRVPPADIG